MTKSDDIEVFSSEYRHKIVEKFIRDLVSWYIELPLPTNLESEHGKFALEKYVTIKTNIEKYVSGRVSSDQRDNIEAELFAEIVEFRILGIPIERKPDFQIKYEIEALNKKNRID